MAFAWTGKGSLGSDFITKEGLSRIETFSMLWYFNNKVSIRAVFTANTIRLILVRPTTAIS